MCWYNLDEHLMNIYLDIDGVLLANEHSAAEYADEFLQGVLAKYPDTTYWLTTHDWIEGNRAIERLTPFLKQETINLLPKIKSTKWDQSKTDGIDFNHPFLWFDDDIYPEEKQALVKNNALQNWIEVNLYKNPNHLKTLAEKYLL